MGKDGKKWIVVLASHELLEMVRDMQAKLSASRGTTVTRSDIVREALWAFRKRAAEWRPPPPLAVTGRPRGSFMREVAGQVARSVAGGAAYGRNVASATAARIGFPIAPGPAAAVILS
jgi:hypothetical protein